MNKIIQYVADNPGVCISQVTALYSYNDLDVCFKCGAIETSQGFNCDPCCLGKGHTIETASAAVEKYIAEQERTMQLEARADCASCDCEETTPLSTALAIYCLFAAIALPVVAGGLLVMILARG